METTTEVFARADDPWRSTQPAEFERLAQAYDTPFYLFDAANIKDRIRALRDSLSALVHVYYAVKANPNLGLLKAIRDVADGLDISSVGELEQAMLAGFLPSQLSFAGPAKTSAELQASIAHGVGCISIESPRELLECAAIARETNTRANIMLRINPLRTNVAF